MKKRGKKTDREQWADMSDEDLVRWMQGMTSMSPEANRLYARLQRELSRRQRAKERSDERS